MSPSLSAEAIAANLNMMHSRIASAAALGKRKSEDIALIAVSKTQDEAAIRAAINAGQLCFGENKVQEARSKFSTLKREFPALKLHLVGALQSNKVKDAVALFDAIHSLDRDHLAETLAREINSSGRNVDLFIQVNTGDEPQKSGIAPQETAHFLKRCRDAFNLNVVGLMCIPPANEEPGLHFALLSKIARDNDLKFLSMGMSDDFEKAIGFGATHIRIGQAIFGHRI